MKDFFEFALRYWAQALFGALVAGLGALTRWLVRRFRENDRRQDAMEKGIQAMLRDRIVQSYYHYSELGYITLHGLEAMDKMYVEYHNLGGNGTVTKLWQELHELEVREQDCACKKHDPRRGPE